VLAVIDDGVVAGRPALAEELEAYARAHAARMQLVETLVLPGGEACKNDPALLESLYQRLRELAIDRHSYVLIVGGGALLDAVGYAAATTHRGVRVLRVPTTTLAQADSAVGVKNGVNFQGSKNFVGTFAPPFAVYVDPAFLRTLSPRDRRAGMAEAVKVSLVRDASFFVWLEEHAQALATGDEAALAHLCRRSAELHLHHIREGGDPFELGSARPLDFGHWAAHKLESLTGHRLRHGEAVAIGMAIDTHYSWRAGFLDAAAVARVLRLLQRLGFQLWDDALDGDAVLAGLDEFREHLGGELTVTLLAGIGRGHEVHVMDPQVVRASIAELPR
jgi:3-dehydroquinate synthase